MSLWRFYYLLFPLSLWSLFSGSFILFLASTFYTGSSDQMFVNIYCFYLRVRHLKIWVEICKRFSFRTSEHCLRLSDRRLASTLSGPQMSDKWELYNLSMQEPSAWGEASVARYFPPTFWEGVHKFSSLPDMLAFFWAPGCSSLTPAPSVTLPLAVFLFRNLLKSFHWFAFDYGLFF